MRCRKFRLTRARSMLGLRDAKEIGIGRMLADSSLLTIFISEELLRRKGALAIFGAESTGSEQ